MLIGPPISLAQPVAATTDHVSHLVRYTLIYLHDHQTSPDPPAAAKAVDSDEDSDYGDEDVGH